MVPMNSFGVPQSPTVQIPSSSYSYDFGMAQSPRDGSWGGQRPDASNTIYEDASQAGYNLQSYSGGLQSNYMDQLTELGSNVGSMGDSPPALNGFVGPGLPFRGLDFIRNYNPSGYMSNDQDAWQASFDATNFGMDPELPFTLGDATIGDLSVDGQNGGQQWSEGQS